MQEVCVGVCSLGLFLGILFLFVFRITAEICLDLVKGCTAKADSYCTGSQRPVTNPFGASQVQGDLSSGSSLPRAICCSHSQKPVLFRVCTGIKVE